ncbi:MAG TPA: hypothetical protein VH137_04190 [Gemmatimonadales bacterium]|nr:hypothetical protein [Gemmatimonadales bacterium]
MMERVLVVLAAVTGGLACDRAAPAAGASLEPVVPVGSTASAEGMAPAAPEPPPEREANFAVAW